MYDLFLGRIFKEIIEKLKNITLLEAVELVKDIEDTFGVDTNISAPISMGTNSEVLTSSQEVSKKEQTEFTVILEQVPGEDQKSKRLSIFRLIREITALGLKDAKELTTKLPQPLKEAISKEQANDIKNQLEEAGAKVKIQ
uniref:Large ribosomal subunit protein bL12c n=1 Tax=Bryopsis sp. HV04063 TaxID=1979421 RepID=A0A2P0QIT5_9CHLO|nr:ribosomal protein L12 [Bryopsis sp. HV04063]ARO74119.1 ribosomal protein L12 [Bryopsis sp. HV04063]